MSRGKLRLEREKHWFVAAVVVPTNVFLENDLFRWPLSLIPMVLSRF